MPDVDSSLFCILPGRIDGGEWDNVACRGECDAGGRATEDVVKTNTENQGTEQIITQFLSDQLLY